MESWGGGGKHLFVFRSLGTQWLRNILNGSSLQNFQMYVVAYAKGLKPLVTKWIEPTALHGCEMFGNRFLFWWLDTHRSNSYLYVCR
jgi:hypothetical protein